MQQLHIPLTASPIIFVHLFVGLEEMHNLLSVFQLLWPYVIQLFSCLFVEGGGRLLWGGLLGEGDAGLLHLFHDLFEVLGVVDESWFDEHLELFVVLVEVEHVLDPVVFELGFGFLVSNELMVFGLGEVGVDIHFLLL